MLIEVKKEELKKLDDIDLIWRCIEPTIQSVRGKCFAVKTDVYSQLNDGQRALLMFQILYGHTLHGIEEFFFYQSYMLSNQGSFSQMVNAMKFFEADDMVTFLEELHTTYGKFGSDIEQHKTQLLDIKKDTLLYQSLRSLNTLFQKSLPKTIQLVSTYIREHEAQFVILE